ncbi:hypothetical protein MML48_6g00006369 [Holotrichia oblita]|uniref:Uncharacterized protein n=1 Tax=Holotrichia oblita TaxID=644536 RepID=A0ACB9T0N2_HOLOL|nr:hypothetical protein MML48_6g00006369 [Holotrichia oblita]
MSTYEISKSSLLSLKAEILRKQEEVNKEKLLNKAKAAQDDVDRYPESEEDERHFSDEYEPARNPDEEWVEYVDCLGRTRKCMRKDLPYLKERDSDLKSKGSNSDNEENNQQENDDKQAGDFDENSELLSNDMRTELLRRKWETEEDELRKKSDIHYQDILFDETQREQRKAEQLRQMRDKQLAARTRAAKNRKRARLGLPPEEENEEEVTKTTESDNDESAEKEKTPEEIAIEKERELMREKHIRPWDYGKEGVKEHIEYTQEDWVHKQRRERKEEFAPPSSYVEDKNSLYFTSKKESKTKNKERKKDSFYIDTSRPPPKINNPSKRKVNPYKTEEQEDSHKTKKFEPKPIVDECIDFDDEQNELMKDYLVFKERFETEERGRGAEIAPPPTFEYYGPSGSKRIKPQVKKVAIEDSISAGLQFLRQQAEKKKNSTNHMEDMFLI